MLTSLILLAHEISFSNKNKKNELSTIRSAYNSSPIQTRIFHSHTAITRWTDEVGPRKPSNPNSLPQFQSKISNPRNAKAQEKFESDSGDEKVGSCWYQLVECTNKTQSPWLKWTTLPSNVRLGGFDIVRASMLSEKWFPKRNVKRI